MKRRPGLKNTSAAFLGISIPYGRSYLCREFPCPLEVTLIRVPPVQAASKPERPPCIETPA
jgi:hypothetical protein